MAIALPTDPGPADTNPSYLDWGGVIRSPLGGVDQKLNRLGDRFAIEVQMPPLPSAEMGQVWVSRLIQAQKDGGLFPWPQGIDVDGVGALAVDGAGQEGTTLNVRGSTTGRKFAEGQFFSVIHGGRRYLHVITAAATANSAGNAALSVEPMMRTSYANGAVIEVDQPMIEGFLEGNARDWTLNVARFIGLSFRIVEAE